VKLDLLAQLESVEHLKLVKLVKRGKYEFHAEYWAEVSEQAKDFICRHHR
jgi:hypothetical protein